MTDSSHASIRVFSIGVADHAEFSDLRFQLRAAYPTVIAGEFATIADFTACGEAKDAELVIVWQRWPDEHPTCQIERMLSLNPLARIVCVYGDWCESDGRTRQNWPPALRVPAWQARRRIDFEIQSLADPGNHALPWTASREEAWLHDVEHSPAAALSDVRIRLEISDPAYRQVVCEQLQRAGAVIMAGDASAVHVRIVDADVWKVPAASRVVDVAEDEVPVIGLSAWAPLDQQMSWKSQGIAAIVAKLDPDALVTTVSAYAKIAEDS